MSFVVGLGLGFIMGFCCICGFYSGNGLGGYTICAYGPHAAPQLVDITMLWVGDTVAMSLVVGLGLNMGFCCIHGFYPYSSTDRLDIQFLPMNQHLPHLRNSMHITICSAL